MSAIGRVAILGGRGMLGTDLTAVLTDQGCLPVVYDLPEFDLCNVQHLEQALSDVDAVINCAAYTNVDGAESDQETAYRVNAEAVGQLGQLAVTKDVPVLHISTDFVFDGQGDQPYGETDTTGPLGIYGASKLRGEQLLEASGCRFCIVRIQWTYGSAGNNFIKKILERAASGQSLKVVDDQVGAPTSTLEVSQALVELLCRPEGPPQGLFHFAAAEYASRYEVARYLVNKQGLDVQVTPCQSNEFVCPAERPLNSRFNCEKISALLAEPIKPWQIPLDQYLESL